MGWTHRMCGECWIVREAAATDAEVEALIKGAGTNAEGIAEAESMRHSIRRPTVLQQPEPGICCFCGGPTRLGIFTRADPKTTKCGGEC